MRTNYFLLLAILLGIIPMSYTHANDSIPKSVILYTPYTKISVSPGASIDYSIDLINNTDQLMNANLSVSGLSASWKHEMKSGGWSLSQLSVLPKEKKTFNLKVEVPLKVNKGNYHFVVYAGNAKLPLDVVVAQKGTYQTEFTTDQPNMQGNSKSTFTFSATLKNQTADQQLYALMANAPRGWNVVFKPNYKQATSAQVEANSTQNVSIDITPPANVEAGSYKIPVRAATGTTSAELELEVVVTGSYQMELTTPRGLLSTDVTAGDIKKIELEVRNTGSSLLKDIQLSANKPADWEVTFEPSKIDALKAGETSTVMATLKASKKALPGDYVTTIMAKTPEVNADAQFRVALKTPLDMSYTYYDSNRGENFTTTKIKEETIGKDTYKYEYDTNGNITDIYKKVNNDWQRLYLYEYDEFNQLITSCDYINQKQYRYDYDEAGNILTETVSRIGAHGQLYDSRVNTYGYDDSNWGDKLTSYNGETITYDEIGNPLSYRDGMTMSWLNGRKLTTLQSGNDSISYKYDSNGVRTSKTVNGVEYTYEYLNGKLMHETRGEKVFEYCYDANGQLYAVSYKANSSTDAVTYYYF